MSAPTLAAYGQYVSDRKMQKALAGELRLTETLIGELLGPAENLGPATFPSWEGCEVAKNDRQRFRELAAHADLVEELVADGITERAKILREIERRRLLAAAANAPQPVGMVAEGVHCAAVENAATLVRPCSVEAIEAA